MDYSLLLAVHNITEEMKSTQTPLLLPPSMLSSPEISKCTTSSDVVTTASSSINGEIATTTTTSTDSGIAISIISNLPTYIQYLRVIEFIRAQQIPSIRTSSLSNADQSLPEPSTDNTETASIRTVRPDTSPGLIQSQQRTSETQTMIRTNSKSPINSIEPTSPLHSANSLIGGDIWYNRQNLSRLAMYVNAFSPRVKLGVCTVDDTVRSMWR